MRRYPYARHHIPGKRGDLERREAEALGRLRGHIVKDEAAKPAARYISAMNLCSPNFAMPALKREVFLAQPSAMLERFEACPELLAEEALCLINPTPEALAEWLKTSAQIPAAQPAAAMPTGKMRNIIDLAANRAKRLV